MFEVPSSAVVAIAIFLSGLLSSLVTTLINSRSSSRKSALDAQMAYMDRLAQDNGELREHIKLLEVRVRKLENKLVLHGLSVPNGEHVAQ